MIIVKIRGGLGNQFFQYAAGQSMAYRNNTTLKLDTAWFDDQTTRNYALPHYQIEAEVASPAEIDHLTGAQLRGLRRKLFNFIQRHRPYYRRNVVEEKIARRFDPNIFRIKEDAYLIGYWQTEKYFKNIEASLRREFRLKEEIGGKNASVANQIEGVNSVSLHVRRGDYVTNPRYRRKFGVCSLGYYQQAFAMIADRISNPRIFVFSDDTAWARENLKFQYSITYVDHNSKEEAHQDLRLMSLCKHHITANSTFSWWGAWLCEHPDKIVVTPERWFKQSDQKMHDLIPDGWHKIGAW